MTGGGGCGQALDGLPDALQEGVRGVGVDGALDRLAPVPIGALIRADGHGVAVEPDVVEVVD